MRASLIYDLNRYNDRAFVGDLHELTRTQVSVSLPQR